jgi:hypothetical protein
MRRCQTDNMVEAQQYRITRPVPLVRIESFCRSLEKVLTRSYQPNDLPRIWRLYVSAECPMCGILICGDELHALAPRRR